MDAASELESSEKLSGSAECVSVKDGVKSTSLLQKPKTYWKLRWESDSGETSSVHENTLRNSTCNADLPFSTSKERIPKDQTTVSSKHPSCEYHLLERSITNNETHNKAKNDLLFAMKDTECNDADWSKLHLLADTALSISNRTPNSVNTRSDLSARQHSCLEDSSASLQSTDAASVAPLRRQSAHVGGSRRRMHVPSESIIPQGSAVIPVAAQYHNFVGINFYKRIGKWTAHLWAHRKQFYAGSYFTITEAASAYDKASLKHFGEAAQLNFDKNDYLQDLITMAPLTKKEYLSLLQKLAKRSKLDRAAEGIHKCPKGWFEARIQHKLPHNRSSKKLKWQFLGRFGNLQDAKRSYRNAKRELED